MSNDADFTGAMQYVRNGLGLKVILVNPDRRYASPRTCEKRISSVCGRVIYRNSQFPDMLEDEVGMIRKPLGW